MKQRPVQQRSEDALNEELARFGLVDGRSRQQPVPEALQSIVDLCDQDQERLLGDPLLQSIRSIAIQALDTDQPSH